MENRYKGLGITSMVLGIASVLLCWTVLISGLCAAVGAALGIYYLSKRKQERGFAITGIATSAVGLILSIGFALVIVFAGVMSDDRIIDEEWIPFYEQQEPYYEEYPEEFFDDYSDFFYDGGEDHHIESF